jgi:hypothetical protein
MVNFPLCSFAGLCFHDPSANAKSFSSNCGTKLGKLFASAPSFESNVSKGSEAYADEEEEDEVDPRFFDFDFSSSFITMSLMASYDCAVSGISPKDCLFARPPDVVVAIRPFSRCCFEVDFEADDSDL